MLLLKSKKSLAIALIALSPLVVSIIECRADGQPPANPPNPANAANPTNPAKPPLSPNAANPANPANPAKPPIQANLPAQPAQTVPANPATPATVPPQLAVGATTPGPSKPVMDSEISKYISHFELKKVTDSSGTHIKVIGLGTPACLQHLHIDLDRPVDDDQGVYAIKITQRDLTDSTGAQLKTENDCDADKTAACTADPDSGCVDLSDKNVGKAIGAFGVQATGLNEDGKITIRDEDSKIPVGGTGKIKFVDVPVSMGGPLDFKTPATLAREAAAKAEQERSQQLLTTCATAEKGNRDAIEQLKELMGPDALADQQKLLDKFEKKANQTDLAAIQDKVDNADNLSTLNDQIDAAQQFAKDHPDMKSDVVKLLVNGIAKKALDIDSDSKDVSSFGNAKFKLIERALMVAHNLDRNNSTLKKQYEIARLERFKFLASTGSDSFYNATTRKDAMNAAQEVAAWAQSSKDPNAAATFQAYQQTFSTTGVPVGMETAQGPAVVGYTPGTVLDRTFAQASLEDQFNAYRQTLIGSSGVSGNPYSTSGIGGNVYGYSPSNGVNSFTPSAGMNNFSPSAGIYGNQYGGSTMNRTF